MTDQRDHPEKKEVELLSFHVGEQEYSVDIMAVREIRGWSKATPLPHAPRYVRGVINLRGSVLPIIDLASRLGLPSSEDCARNVIIVVCVADQTLGLLVNAVSDILALPVEDLQTPPELAADNSRSFINALTIVEGRMIRVLDLNSVLPETSGLAA